MVRFHLDGVLHHRLHLHHLKCSMHYSTLSFVASSVCCHATHADLTLAWWRVRASNP